ncbi:hypothetical protein ISCGN_002127 [Ixodes scapularis]
MIASSSAVPAEQENRGPSLERFAFSPLEGEQRAGDADTAELTHHTDSDTVTFAATGATSEVTLVDFRGYKSHYITEDVDGNAKVGKIYDVDLTCTNGQELYEEVCPDGCGMVATRSFVF